MDEGSRMERHSESPNREGDPPCSTDDYYSMLSPPPIKRNPASSESAPRVPTFRKKERGFATALTTRDFLSSVALTSVTTSRALVAPATPASRRTDEDDNDDDNDGDSDDDRDDNGSDGAKVQLPAHAQCGGSIPSSTRQQTEPGLGQVFTKPPPQLESPNLNRLVAPLSQATRLGAVRIWASGATRPRLATAPLGE